MTGDVEDFGLDSSERHVSTLDALEDARDGFRRAASVAPNPRHATRFRFTAGRIEDLIGSYKKSESVIREFEERENSEP